VGGGATYWDSKKIITVKSAAGMNFAVSRAAFNSVGGFNAALGPSGDRPGKRVLEAAWC